MATADDVQRIALGLEGTEVHQHFDRTAFRVRRIYATVAPDLDTINLMFTPDEQAMKVMMLPLAYRRVPNKWGDNGATELRLDAVDAEELAAALDMAWRHAIKRSRRG